MTEAASAQLPATAVEIRRLVRDDLLIKIEAVAVAGLLAGLSGARGRPRQRSGVGPRATQAPAAYQPSESIVHIHLGRVMCGTPVR